ncbi:MAG: tRNA (adenosine(37)-N6)-threonylcarbamoyltransferase complex transferase subunit TsaD [Candidatus Omnitrophota bacterium]|nr:tRNA (adenosine(37)-N6)-threonylcarbamoyltransferase complex transferase subunit TsaD [Candidatus Omnitrophota bacterium]
MLILGIETSCDETSVAVVKDNKILSNSVSSSVHLHKDFGGVIPEIAARYHVEYINYVLDDALKTAGKRLKDIDLIAVTTRPGLVGALLVGISLAKALSLALDIPLVGVDHLIAHLYAAFLNGGPAPRPEARGAGYPFVGLVVSGGHTNLFLARDIKRYKLLGQTLDDAAGEAFDKVAKMLRLGYPGGPVIEKRALMGRIDKKLFSRDDFDESLNFSFSGMKTAVLYHIRDIPRRSLGQEGQTVLSRQEVNNIAASFQDAVTDILVKKALEAVRREKVSTLVLGGGVTANSVLRDKMAERAQYNGVKLYLPPVKLCLDNAAMVAGLGGALYKKGVRSDLYITAQSSSSYTIAKCTTSDCNGPKEQRSR